MMTTIFKPASVGKRDDLVQYPPRFTAKQKQQVASNWLLPRELLNVVTVSTASVGGKALKHCVENGTIWRNGTTFAVTWLDLPEACYVSPLVYVSFRSPPPASRCICYAVVKLPTEAQLDAHFSKLAKELP